MPVLFKRNILAAAVAAALPAIVLLGWSSTAQAQFQDTTGGHALDASNRIGSGGYNGPAVSHYDYNVNNNVVTGNVSGLNYFHGNKTSEFDPNVFQGNTGSSSFNGFNSAAAPVNYAQRGTGQPNYVPYYNTGNQVGAPPQNFVSAPGGLGYIPAPAISPLTPTGYDGRLDLTNTDPTKGNLLTQGQLNVAGPVDPSTGTQSMFSMSPLYGVQNGAPNGKQNSMFNSQTYNTPTRSPANPARMTPADVQRMRNELNNTVVPTNQTNSNNTSTSNQNNNQTNAVQNPGTAGPAGQTSPLAGSNLNSSLQLNNPAAQTNNLASNQSLNNPVTNTQLSSSLNSGQSLQNQLIVPPAKQSKQLAELERRFAKDKSKPDDVQATQRLNQELIAQRTAAQNFDAGASKNTKTENTNPDNTAPKPAAQPILTKPGASAEDNQPYLITSLAAGIDAKGLAGLMKTAEDQMRQGKFTEAVDTYDTAEQVAPNNGFVYLGRGFAGLGASYYGKADQDLTRAFNSEPAILLGKYDLKGFLGEDRLKFVHDDLEDIANQEKGARPLVLLGFIAHNSGDDILAGKDLAEAQRRGGYADVIKTMREAWNIK
jgi:hypothetical protein